jgi:hypothetical protein
MSATAVVDQSARKTIHRASAVAIKGDSGCENRGLFAGVADWPDIDQVFLEWSLRILARGGISAWNGMGGRRGFDGRLGFGAVSSPALEIVGKLAETSGGFRWADDAGLTWAVRFAEDDGHDPDRLAFAVTYRGRVWTIDAQRRGPALQALGIQIKICSQPGRFWDNADRARYGGLSRALRGLRLVDGAERILSHLQQRTDDEQAGYVLLSAEEIAGVLRPTDGVDRSNPTVNELGAMLRATTGFEIAQLRLGRLGWNPRILRQAAAVADVEQVGAEAFRVRVAPLFHEVVAAFVKAVNPQQAKRSPRRAARLDEIPAILVGQERERS